MSNTPVPIDITTISSNKDLLRLAEEVKETKTPRVLTKDDETLVVLMPVAKGSTPESDIFAALSQNETFIKEAAEAKVSWPQTLLHSLILLKNTPISLSQLNNMYQIYAKNRSVEKDFEKLLSSLSDQQQRNMMTVLATSPKATQASGGVLNKIEKRGRYWQYFPTGGDRVIFDVIEARGAKQVLILFAGNHDQAKLFLREHR